jgi:hypothetical protein
MVITGNEKAWNRLSGGYWVLQNEKSTEPMVRNKFKKHENKI